MLGEILNEGLRKGFVKKVRTPRHGNIPGRGRGKCKDLMTVRSRKRPVCLLCRALRTGEKIRVWATQSDCVEPQRSSELLGFYFM